MKQKLASKYRGVSLPCVLTLIFLVLKLVGVIHWSWLWVFAPTWIPLAIGCVGAFIIVLLDRSGDDEEDDDDDERY